MSEVVVLDLEKATLFFHPEAGIVHHSFKQSVSGDDFRLVLSEGLKLLEDPEVDKWLSDDLHNLDLTPEDRDWADNWWRPRAIAAGWKYWAVVMPENAFGVVDMAAHVTAARREGIEVSVFSEAGAALAWLQSLPSAREDSGA